jgi:YD repeat-containing protein
MGVEYDAEGNRIREVDANGHATQLGYDYLNRRISMTDPLNRTRRWRYNADGSLREQENARGQITACEYDSLGRRVRRWNQDTDDRWTYDEVGNVLTHTTSVTA